MSYLITLLFIMGLVITGIVGWIKNIIWLFGSEEITAEFIVRLVGVPFALIGAIAGYL